MWEIAGTRLDKPGNDESAAATFAPYQGARKALSELTKKGVFRFA
jgi:hypothetical protein